MRLCCRGVHERRSLELALALVRYGFRVPEIYGTITAEKFCIYTASCGIESGYKGFSNMEPTMLY